MNQLNTLWQTFKYHYDLPTMSILLIITIMGGSLFHLYGYNNNLPIAYMFGGAYYIVAYLFVKTHKITYRR